MLSSPNNILVDHNGDWVDEIRLLMGRNVNRECIAALNGTKYSLSNVSELYLNALLTKAKSLRSQP